MTLRKVWMWLMSSKKRPNKQKCLHRGPVKPSKIQWNYSIFTGVLLNKVNCFVFVSQQTTGKHQSYHLYVPRCNLQFSVCNILMFGEMGGREACKPCEMTSIDYTEALGYNGHV